MLQDITITAQPRMSERRAALYQLDTSYLQMVYHAVYRLHDDHLRALSKRQQLTSTQDAVKSQQGVTVVYKHAAVLCLVLQHLCCGR
jgi:hypothetical protein